MYVGIVVLALLWSAVRVRYGGAPWPKAPRLNRSWEAALSACALLALLAAQLWIVAFETQHQIAPPCFLRVPFPVVADLDDNSGGPAMAVPGAALAIVSILQVLALTCLYLSLTQRPPQGVERRVVGGAFALAVLLAVAAPSMTSTDAYLYLSFAKVGFASFAAAPHAIRIPDFPQSVECWKRLFPSAYGPIFIAYVRAILSPVHDPATAVIVLRATNVLWLLAAIAVMRRLKVPEPTVMLLAFNPVVLYEFVANAHNDLIPVTLAVAAFAVDNLAPLAFALALLAGLVKLPFAAIGWLASSQDAGLVKRLTFSALLTGLTVAISYLWAGPSYFLGLSWYGRVLWAGGSDRAEPLLAAVAVAALVLGVLYRRYFGVASFAFATLAVSEIQPWHALWGLPYAVRERTGLPIFLALLPLAAFLMNDTISDRVRLVLYGAVAIAIALLTLRDLSLGKRVVTDSQSG